MSKSKYLHLFLYVVSRVDDPFKGIKKTLSQNSDNSHNIKNIKLSEEDYAIIRHVEYSYLKYIRVFYYKNIYKYLEKRIHEELVGLESYKRVAIYLSDEGVWAEIIKVILKRYKHKIYTVNVQHGFFLLERRGVENNVSLYVRKKINLVSRTMTGFPLLGLGFGRGGFDAYLCYGEKEKYFLQHCQSKSVFVCPELIKESLWQRYIKSVSENENNIDSAGESILIAMPAFVFGSEIRCNLSAFLKIITPIIMFLVIDLHYEVIVRFHPGKNKNECLEELKNSGLAKFVKVDNAYDVVDSMVNCSVVMAVHSTVLFEAMLLGKVPVSIRSECFSKQLSYKHEIVDISLDFRGMLAHALSDVVKEQYNCFFDKTNFNWPNEFVKLE